MIDLIHIGDYKTGTSWWHLYRYPQGNAPVKTTHHQHNTSNDGGVWRFSGTEIRWRTGPPNGMDWPTTGSRFCFGPSRHKTLSEPLRFVCNDVDTQRGLVSQVAFAIEPSLDRNRLFDITAARDACLECYILLKQALNKNGINCATLDMCDASSIDVLVCSDIGISLREAIKVIKSHPMVRILYIPTEPPVLSCLHSSAILGVLPFDRVLSWNDDFVRRYEHGVKCSIGQPLIDPELIPSQPFWEKRFLVAIYSNKMLRHENGLYEERIRAFDFFSGKSAEFDLYGMGWDKSTHSSVVSSYLGKCGTKKDILKNYKFSICFENSKGYPGYITEKIFDCFVSGTVPIYYGAPNVQEYIPSACFIDFRDFASYEDLYQFLVNMDDTEYQAYLDAVKEFIKTPQYYEFTSKRYAEIVLEQIQSLMNEPKSRRTVFGFKLALLKIVMMHPFLFLKNINRCRRFLFDLVAAW